MIRAVQSQQLRGIARVAFYPVLVFGTLAAYFCLAEASLATLSALTAGLAVISIAIIHAFERLFPYRPEWNVSSGDRMTNFFLTNIVLPMAAKAVELAVTAAALILMSDLVRDKLHALWPRDGALGLQLLLAIGICEFCFYWIHRWGHKKLALWRFHSIHHSVKRVYWNNSGRFHPVDMLLNLVVYIAPLVLLGVPPIVVGAFLTLNAVTGLLEHANVDYEAGPLNYVFNTAQLHRWHHSTDPVVSSKNFGKILCTWDLVFGTWWKPDGEEVGEVGVMTESIPDDLLGQIVHPFKRSQLPEGHEMIEPDKKSRGA